MYKKMNNKNYKKSFKSTTPKVDERRWSSFYMCFSMIGVFVIVSTPVLQIKYL